MAAAISTKAMTALMNEPYRKWLLLTVNVSLEKSDLPKMAPTSGVIRSATRAVTTAPKATPMTTATARSTTLPRKMNSLKPFSTVPSFSISADRARRSADSR